MCRRLGVARAVRLGAGELLFDLRHGTETGIDVAARHEGASPWMFAKLVRVLPADGRRVLLDLGAGKGRALLLAARHGFREAVGVELSPELCAVARANLRGRRAGAGSCRTEVHCADAAGFEVPDRVDTVFLFDPFPEETLRAAVGRLTASLERAPREVHVLYQHPRLARVLTEAGFSPVYRIGSEGMVLRRDGRADGAAAPAPGAAYRRDRKS
ncbi:class I SAM-dependent methyltransferase [Kitasatospora sp. NPDC006786]|uniref:class I SAM-dependent methyltransferase n=1 Tax=unclassified Kitasatospora TaxID=2633591 RepID=UPI0033ED70E8